MARTLMISNDVYDKLKRIKESKNMSFSELIKDMIESKSPKGENLRMFLGVLKGDVEYDKVVKELKSGWSGWKRRLDIW